jgi:hypothetical protein
MALSLSCPCGATFEVEDTFAGQTVSCPECQASVRAPAVRHGPVRTSGLAISSMVLAVVGAFTLIGTVAAVLCGLGALLSIGRSGGRLAGAGFAVFGIVLGIVFTGLTLFAHSKGELLGVGDQLRMLELGGQADFTGPLEIVRAEQGYKITRPSERWGVARHELARQFHDESNLLLINPAREAYVDVTVSPVLFNQGIDDLRQQVVRNFTESERNQANTPEGFRRISGVKVRESKRVKAEDGYEVGEVILDAKSMNLPWTYLVQVVKKSLGKKAYVVRSWTPKRRFPQEEEDMRRVVESLRILD